MIAEARQQFIEAVGGRRKPQLVEKDARKAVAAKELAQAAKGFPARRGIVGADKAEGFLDLGVFLRPAAPTSARLASPIHDEVRVLHSIDVGEQIVPEEHLVHRSAWAAKFAEDFRRFAKSYDKEVKIEDARFKDGELSFKALRARSGQELLVKYKGKLTGDAIKGKITVSIGDDERTFDWEAKRVKEEKAKEGK